VLEHGFRFQIRKSQQAYEKTHGEADAAEDRDAVDLAPTGASGKHREARFLCQVDGRKNSDLLAEEETADDAEPERRQKRYLSGRVDRHAGIGEAEDRQHQKGHPGRQRALHAVQQRVPALAGAAEGNHHGQHHTRERCVNA
jgi:hypothetical protein